MANDKKNEDTKFNPEWKDLEPGSDADATPVPEVGKTPPDPNKKQLVLLPTATDPIAAIGALCPRSRKLPSAVFRHRHFVGSMTSLAIDDDPR